MFKSLVLSSNYACTLWQSSIIFKSYLRKLPVLGLVSKGSMYSNPCVELSFSPHDQLLGRLIVRHRLHKATYCFML